MQRPDTSAWPEIGSTSGYVGYEAAPDLLVLVPPDGVRETAETARENLAFQDAHWRAKGHTGCVALFVDGVADQTAEARRVYAEETERALTHGLALIGGTFFGRAVATAFIKLRRYRIPVRMFPSLDAAMPWIREVNAAHRRPVAPEP